MPTPTRYLFFSSPTNQPTNHPTPPTPPPPGLHLGTKKTEVPWGAGSCTMMMMMIVDDRRCRRRWPKESGIFYFLFGRGEDFRILATKKKKDTSGRHIMKGKFFFLKSPYVDNKHQAQKISPKL
jgi:hypothetical protein